MSEEKKQRQQTPGMYQPQMQSGGYSPMMYQPGYTQQQPVYYPSYGYPPFQSPTQNQPSSSQVPGMLPIEESYIENILRLNKGKVATIYMTFENNDRWNAKIFKGIIEAAGRDHIIISDPETNKRYLLLTIYLDYITFDGEIEYDYPRTRTYAR
ncbi:spore coat protein GerQ [Paraliobacillus ryukyuensis]|nr:spore coat protein GerQ [Paraliobacillus ryukyuensis]